MGLEEILRHCPKVELDLHEWIPDKTNQYATSEEAREKEPAAYEEMGIAIGPE